MTEEEMKALAPGDIVRGSVSGQSFVVTGNYGDHVTAVVTVDLTNEAQWSLVSKANRTAT